MTIVIFEFEVCALIRSFVTQLYLKLYDKQETIRKKQYSTDNLKLNTK